MLNFTEGIFTLTVGVLSAGAPHANAPNIGAVGGVSAAYDTALHGGAASIDSCETLGGGGVVMRCKDPGDQVRTSTSQWWDLRRPQALRRSDPLLIWRDSAGSVAGTEATAKESGGARYDLPSPHIL
jgi:hypothetical protein